MVGGYSQGGGGGGGQPASKGGRMSPPPSNETLMHIVSSDSILRFRQFTHSLHVRTIVLAMRLCTQNVAMPTIMPKFCDQKSNHEIHENLKLYSIGLSLT